MSIVKSPVPLLPCPFCGGPVQLELANINQHRYDLYGDRHWYGVTCRNTINHGGTCCMDQVPSASKEAAIERWNMRDGTAQREHFAKICEDFADSYSYTERKSRAVRRAIRILAETIRAGK